MLHVLAAAMFLSYKRKHQHSDGSPGPGLEIREALNGSGAV